MNDGKKKKTPKYEKPKTENESKEKILTRAKRQVFDTPERGNLGPDGAKTEEFK